MLPSVVSTSASTARSSGMPATAKPVAVGGCACTTACDVGPLPIHLEVHQHLGRRIAIALRSCVPSRSVTHHHVRRHEPLADALRGHEQPVVVEAHADVAVVRRGVPARVHPAADLDDVGAERGFGGHAVRGSDTGRGRRPSRSKRGALPSASITARSGMTNVPQTGSRTICTPRARHAARARGAPASPSTMPSKRRQNARATTARRAARNRTSRAASRTWLLRRRRPPDAPTQAVERPLRRLAFGLSGASWMTCCHACAAPSRSCLPNALDDADVQERLGVLGSSSANGRTARAPCPAGSCSSRRRRDRC